MRVHLVQILLAYASTEREKNTDRCVAEAFPNTHLSMREYIPNQGHARAQLMQVLLIETNHHIRDARKKSHSANGYW